MGRNNWRSSILELFTGGEWLLIVALLIVAVGAGWGIYAIAAQDALHYREDKRAAQLLGAFLHNQGGQAFVEADDLAWMAGPGQTFTIVFEPTESGGMELRLEAGR